MVAVQVTRKESDPRAIELIVHGLNHETSLDEVGPCFRRSRVLQALSCHGGPECFGLLVVHCCTSTSHGHLEVCGRRAVGRWCLTANRHQGLNALKDAVMDFAHAKLIQQHAGKGELRMCLGEVESVCDISFRGEKRVDAAQNLRKGWSRKLSGFSNCGFVIWQVDITENIGPRSEFPANS